MERIQTILHEKVFTPVTAVRMETFKFFKLELELM